MSRSLFLLVVLGGVLCLGATAQAQQQEARINQILRPDESKSFDLTAQKKFGTTGYNTKTAKVLECKAITESRQYSLKTFLTGSFRSDKSFWMGDFKYSVGAASPQPRYLFTLPGKSFLTKNAAVKSATGYDKTYEVANIPTRDYRGTGAFSTAREGDKLKKMLTPEQAANNGYQGDLTELKSIDDIRALLNKSK